ncbi:hypothetical protein K3495_g13497 [Podosphaera aphanis]|nr:hypothetical protein K3495_g13497 [Podosphaera aphanis]
MPFFSRLVLSSLVITAIISRLRFLRYVLRFFTGPGRYSRLLATAVIIANVKTLPFIWHMRVWSAILKHCLFCKPKVPPEIAPSTLFLPVITSSRSPFSECDYNLHKSNSTYFSDLDVARSHIICALLEPGIYRTQRNARERLVLTPEGIPVIGRWGVNLGGTACNFKREIGIYEPYEMWTRLLCWDRKWLYFVTHFVKKGTMRPSSYILTDGGWFHGGYRTITTENCDTQPMDQIDQKAIFASAISKFVVKLGRLTVHPEVILNAANVLPPKPGGWHSMNNSAQNSPCLSISPEFEKEMQVETKAYGETSESAWQKVESQNRRGLKYAEHFAALDGLGNEFSGNLTPALGKFTDFII